MHSANLKPMDPIMTYPPIVWDVEIYMVTPAIAPNMNMMLRMFRILNSVVFWSLSWMC